MLRITIDRELLLAVDFFGRNAQFKLMFYMVDSASAYKSSDINIQPATTVPRA